MLAPRKRPCSAVAGTSMLTSKPSPAQPVKDTSEMALLEAFLFRNGTLMGPAKVVLESLDWSASYGLPFTSLPSHIAHQSGRNIVDAG